MDIIDIMLARAMTPQGQTEAYVAIANDAAAKAEKAKDDAETAIATVTSAAEDIADTQTAAAALLEDAQEALETAQQAQINVPTTEDIDAEVKKLNVAINVVDGTNAKTIQVQTTYPDNTLHTENVTKLYKSAGNNEDGTMTQKAIKAYIDSIPAGSGSGSGGISNLGTDNSGQMVVIGPDGNISASSITEQLLIETLLQNGEYVVNGTLGLEINYANKSFTRTQDAAGMTMGANFNEYSMYGGRKRCVVNNNGEILAFQGDNNFDSYISGETGQVMIYQPKFYYQRIPLVTTNGKVGKIVSKESLILSSTPQNGFKLHPLFINTDGEELDYVLLSAYEGGVYDVSAGLTASTVASNVDFNNDLLTSVPSSKPITGSSDLTLARAEQLAANRGAGWHAFNMAAESANQMLEIVEFGTLNGQTALGKGISDITTNGNKNQAALTGATASLGNTSGAAATTTFELDGQTFTETTNGKTAISYRGFENPWGNIWTMIAGTTIKGNGAQNGGIPYVCNNYNYSYSSPDNNYTSVDFTLPNASNWISSLGYGSSNYDWVLMPIACDENANSVLPIGDSGWFDANLSGNRIVVVGGSWSFGESNGPFYYGCDKLPSDTTYKSYGTRLMFIPTKNSIYNTNIQKWENTMG